MCARQIFGERVAQYPVIAKRIISSGRNGVDGFFADQFFDIQHIAQFGVFHGCAGPQHALRLRSLGRQRVPSRPGEYFLITFVSQLRVGDGNFTADAVDQGLLRRRGIGGFAVQLRVNQTINAADEEASDAGYTRHLQPLGRAAFDSAHEGLGHLFVGILRKQQRNVDVDSFGQQNFDGRNSGGGAGHFDHQIRASHRGPQAARFLQGFLRLCREIRRDFQTHVAVFVLAAIIHRLQRIGGVLNIANGNALENGLGVQRRIWPQRGQQIVVLRARGNGLFEDRGI